ncbi:PAS domain S-box protein [Pseudanabaena biceps]|nr:PAS domain S-box protein [Pseudanabaena biceps]
MNKRISHIAGLTVIAIAVIVLLGWQLNISLLKSGFPFISATMKVNTAICFLFAGMSLILLQRQQTKLYYRVSQGFAGAIVAIALLTLSEYLFGWDLHIDQLIFPDVVSLGTPYAGRMGVNTAFNFVLMGTALFLLGRNHKRDTDLAQICSSVAALVSLLALFGHIFHVDILARLVILTTTQALNTILSFFILYVGILWLRPKRGLMQVLTSALVGGKMARMLLPWALIFPLAINWLTFQGHQLGWYSVEFANTIRATTVVFTFSILIWGTARFLNQIDLKRQKAQLELKRINETLESLIAERTEALEKSKARFAGILDIANDAIISVDHTQRITLFNQGAEKIFGYKQEEILWQPLDLLLPEQFRNDHQQHIQQFAQSSIASAQRARRMGERGEIWGRRQDGTEFPAEASISRLEMGDETVFTVILRDISDRKQSETSLAHMASIVEYSGEGIVSKSLDGIVLSWNNSAENIFGYKAEEIIGQSITTIFPPNLIYEEEQILETIRQGKTIEEYETMRVRKDGKLINISCTISPLKDPKGKIIGASVIKRDITDRKKAERERQHIEIALQNSEEQFRQAFEYASTGMAILSLDGHWLKVNQALCQIVGYSSEELLASTFQDITHPDDVAVDRDNIEHILAGTISTYQREKRYLHKQGHIVWIRLNGSVVQDTQGNRLHIIAHIQDITARKDARKTLELQSIIMNNMAGGVCLVKASDLTIGYTNPKFDAMFGYAEGELAGQSVGVINYVDTKITPDETVEDIVTQIDRDGEAQYEVYNKKKDGTLFWCRVHTSRFDHPEYGTVYVAVQEDVTEIKQAQLELQQAKEAAESANLAKSMFLSNMSHELRTPLNAILGFTELMSYDPSLSDDNKEDLAIVNRSGKHLLALINDVLDLSKIESGQMKLNLSDFELENLLTSIEELFQVQAQSKGLQLIIDRDPTLPQFIHADEKKIYQVLVNLLGNAIKFTKQGSIILRVKQQEITASNKSQILFAVEDTGVGIAPTEIDSLFKVFVQAQAGSKFNQGTGLGLAISQKFIQLMDSQIYVQSTLNQGSTFYFELGVALPQSVPLNLKSHRQRVIGLATGQPTYRILVVEDIKENRLLLVKLLTSVGFEVREATQGVEALALWESWSPHLIWMDLRMPVMDGYATTKRIRELPNGQETIIIALTASVFEEEREKVLMAGCNDFIGKPFQEKSIFDKLTQHLGVKYIYATEERQPQKLVDTLSQEDLAMMSPQWLEQMYQAAYYLDTEVMNVLIAQIPESSSGLSKALTHATNNFNADRIMELIRPLLPSSFVL